jgi:alpha-ketoglutarate-dependent 2,4-dichlorophenoxyacetate dioxygenase
MEVRKLHPLFAAELTGVDIADAHDPKLVDLVEDLMREHAVLCIRGQGHLDDEQHLAFARAFGPLELPAPSADDKPRRIAFGLYDASNLNENGDIIEIGSLRAKFAKGNELFHADSSYNDLPSKWSILRGVIIPPERGDTQFIDMRAVYEALPAEMKVRIADLKAEHNFYHSRRKAGAPAKEDTSISRYMRAEHPLVRESASGRPTLFVGAHAARIVGMDVAEGVALIEELLAFSQQAEFVYSHKWAQGDVLIWDNRCTLHRGTEFDYERYKRDLRRANVNEFGDERCAAPKAPTFSPQTAGLQRP